MKSIFLLKILFLLIRQHGCDLIQTPIIGIEMSPEGFHRALRYSVQFETPLAEKECEYVLEQLLPAAVYVSIDQLNDLKRLNKLNAIYPKFVDVEVPTEKAQPFSVLLKGTPMVMDTIILPIHFRYHAPRTESSFVTVNISKPNVYMRCPQEDDDFSGGDEMQTSPNVSYCLNEKFCNFVDSSTSYNVDEVVDCGWKLINANISETTALSAQIPVGDERAYPPLLYFTIIISWAVSLWTVYTTRHIPRRINYKLEEQRILQDKLK